MSAKDIEIKMSVSLSDGSFESFVSVPISHSDKFEQMAPAWMDMMRKALSLVEHPKEQK